MRMNAAAAQANPHASPARGDRGTVGPRPTCRLPAFTLLEVVMVLVIVAIVAAIAVPRYAAALHRYRAEHAARRIAADLEYARALARQSSATQRVVFDADADTYTLPGRADLDHPKETYTVDLADAPYRADLAAASFGAAATAVFDGFGMPRVGGAVKVAAGGYVYLVTVDGETGEIGVAGPFAP